MNNNNYIIKKFIYQNNQNFYPQNQPQGESKSFLQKVGSSAMNIIKKEDPIYLINGKSKSKSKSKSKPNPKPE